MAKQYSCLQLCAAILLVVLASHAIIPSGCVRDLNQKPANRATLFVFGDSLYDSGNNNYINTTTDFQANFYPYGETFFGYPTGRFCNGRVVPDFIAEFAKLPLIPTFLGPHVHHQMAYGFNFASAGAGALAETNSGLVIDLQKQLKEFRKVKKKLKEKLGNGGTKQLVADAIYLFSVGTNDYLAPSSSFKSFSPQEYMAMVVGNITAAFEEIYQKGGRKFAITNLGPLGCLPIVRAAGVAAGGNGSCNDSITGLAKAHNVFLAVGLEQLQKQLQGFKYSYFDSFSTALDVLANPSKYGFKEAQSACCGSGPFQGIFSCGGKREVKQFQLCSDPQDFTFFDSIHPTDAANLLSAAAMWAGPPNVTWPYNLQTLFQLA